jgi:hypothetical protein
MHNQKNTEQIVVLCLLQRHRILAVFCARKPYTNLAKIWKDVIAVALPHMHHVKKVVVLLLMFLIRMKLQNTPCN